MTKKLTLSTRVALEQGHALFAPTRDWTGSTEQFWAANPANPLREMNDLYGTRKTAAVRAGRPVAGEKMGVSESLSAARYLVNDR